MTCSHALTPLTGSCSPGRLPGAGDRTVQNLATSSCRFPPEPCSSPASHCAVGVLLSAAATNNAQMIIRRCRSLNSAQKRQAVLHPAWGQLAG